MPDVANAPFVLIIRDGWGTNPHAEHHDFNAIELAETPVADMLDRQWPKALIATSGEDVGLPAGTMGNSEVGHQNIGAGRVVYQDSVRISLACRENRLGEVAALTEAIDGARDAGKAVHLMGIASDAGVHGLLDHLYALVELCRDREMPRVVLHLFTDGRDTGPFTGKGYIETVEAKLAEIGIGEIGSVIGRYWSMDRDFRWDRIQRAYDCLTGRGDFATAVSAGEAIQSHYDEPASAGMKGDEFVPPTAVGIEPAATRIGDGDAVIFYNYRGDRPREICSAFLMDPFLGAVAPSPESGEKGFDRGPKLDLRFVLMTPYSQDLAKLAPVAFVKPPKMEDIAGMYWSRLGLRQFRCAETEKYPHVTFFFNDYRDEPFEGESRSIAQSPQDVATYDEKPEMSAAGVRDAGLGRLAASDCEDVIGVNFANGDMVGHTGSLEAATRACEVVDAAVGEIIDATLKRGGSLIVTADHGNAEQMFDPKTGSPHTAHTTYTVPMYVVGEAFAGRTLKDGGRLADIVPTSLAMMGLPKPEAMTGESLLTD